MKAMRNIIDTWNMIEKYNIKGWKVQDYSTILIPAEEYSRLMDSVLNKQYIRNISKQTGNLNPDLSGVRGEKSKEETDDDEFTDYWNSLHDEWHYRGG